MSDIAGAQAISAVTRGDVREVHSRTFAVRSRDGERVYLVTVASVDGALRAECTCKAGQNGQPCWHLRAASLVARRAVGVDPEPAVGDLEPDRL